jgi:hypothetical protein
VTIDRIILQISTEHGESTRKDLETPPLITGLTMTFTELGHNIRRMILAKIGSPRFDCLKDSIVFYHTGTKKME